MLQTFSFSPHSTLWGKHFCAIPTLQMERLSRKRLQVKGGGTRLMRGDFGIPKLLLINNVLSGGCAGRFCRGGVGGLEMIHCST